MARVKEGLGEMGKKRNNWVVLNGTRDNYSTRRQINE